MVGQGTHGNHAKEKRAMRTCAMALDLTDDGFRVCCLRFSTAFSV